MTVKLDILSDPICPWCLIGKTWLDRALEQRPDHPFIVEWHPFQLNPDMPAEGMDRRAYLEAKFGGKTAAVRVYGQIEQAAEKAGVTIDWSRITRTPNTLNAHRLIHWAGLEGRQAAMVAALFAAFFQNGRDIGDVATLVELAAAVGMDPAVVARLLASDADRAEIAARDTHARARGVGAVPTYLIANQYVLSGAQPVDLWGQVIAELAAVK